MASILEVWIDSLLVKKVRSVAVEGRRGDLKGETESEIIAAQAQALQTKYHATKILQTETDSKCQQFYETIYHITSACPILAKEQYTKRHDCVCAEQHFNISKEIGVILDSDHWYEHVPKLEELVTKVSYGTNK